VLRCSIFIGLRRYRIYRVILLRRRDIPPDRRKASTREPIQRNRTETRMSCLRNSRRRSYRAANFRLQDMGTTPTSLTLQVFSAVSRRCPEFTSDGNRSHLLLHVPKHTKSPLIGAKTVLRLLQMGSFTFPFLPLDPCRIRRCLMTTKASPTLHYRHFQRSRLAVCCGRSWGRHNRVWIIQVLRWPSPAGKPHSSPAQRFVPPYPDSGISGGQVPHDP
jgi:hypothetical protein